jgi:hypothetical protein
MRTSTMIAGLLVGVILVVGTKVRAGQDSFAIVGVTSATEVAGSNQALGVSFTWVPPDPNVKAMLLTARIAVKDAETISSRAFKLKYQSGEQQEARSCVALGVTTSAKDRPNLTSGASMEVRWAAPAAGTYFLTLVFINVPRGLEDALLFRDGVLVGKVRVTN